MTLSAAPTLPDIEVQARHAAASANTIGVQFFYHTGIAQDVFSNVGCAAAGTIADFPARGGRPHRCGNTRASRAGPRTPPPSNSPTPRSAPEYSWGVIADSGSGRDLWAIPTEVPDPDSAARQRTFTLAPDPSEQHYWLSTSRQLGLNPRWTPYGAQRIQRFIAVLPRAGFVVFRRL